MSEGSDKLPVETFLGVETGSVVLVDGEEHLLTGIDANGPGVRVYFSHRRADYKISGEASEILDRHDVEVPEDD